MREFDYHRATGTASAVAAVSADPGAVFLGGGTNLVDHMQLGVAAPAALVDITRLGLDTVEDTGDGGLRIGAGVRNSDLAAHPLVRRRFPALSQALLSGASGQLRNLATTGGNLLQRTRCRYFQDVTTPCNKRTPGSGCAAIGGMGRHHAVLGASEHCVATHPSDMAVAMAALDAVAVVTGPGGPRRIPVTDLHRLPGDTPQHDTVLAHGDLITHVDLPAPAPGALSGYRKVRDRASFAFALVSVALEVAVDAGTVTGARVAFGGLAHKPWRARAAEQALVGGPATRRAALAAADAELAGARTLDGNAYKVPLARATLATALAELTGPTGTDAADATEAHR